MKHVFALMVLFLTFAATAQPNPEKKAQKFTDEMTKVLSLNTEEAKAIYDIQVNRFKENQAIQKEFGNDPETKKEKMKDLGNKVFAEVRNVLGKERQQQWKAYKESN